MKVHTAGLPPKFIDEPAPEPTKKVEPVLPSVAHAMAMADARQKLIDNAEKAK